MGREVRRVPKDWAHPAGACLLENYTERLAEWDEGNRQWNLGFRDDWDGGWKPLDGTEKSSSYEEWSGTRPEESDYMPEWPEEERTHLMMYETCSEGTPISPAFNNPEDLARWLVNNHASAFGDRRASYEGWLRVAKGGYACSAVSSGAGLQSGVDGLTHTEVK